MVPAKRVDNKGRKLPDGISQRADGRYQARFTYKGKRYTLYDMDLKKVQRKVVQKKNDLYNGIYNSTKDITLNRWFEEWLIVYKRNKIKETSYRNYRYNWNYYVSSTLGEMKLKDIRRIHIIAAYNRLLTETGLSARSIKHVNNILQQVLEQAVHNDLLQKNPAKRVIQELKLPAIKEREALTEKEETEFMQYIWQSGQLKWANFFTIAFGTGLRVGEQCALLWEDIDFEKNTIDVNKTISYLCELDGATPRYLVTTPKTESSVRKVPMLPEVRRAFLCQRELNQVFKFAKQKEYKDYVFLSNKGKPCTEGTVGARLKALLNSYNIEAKQRQENGEEAYPILQLTPHITRHTFASRCYERGIDPKVIQKLLGHAHIGITMDTYTHCSEDLVRSEFIENFHK